MKLIYYPNKILETACEPYAFNEGSEVELKDIYACMEKIMLEHKGVGLAANQVGLTQRFIVIKDNKGTVHHFTNPVVIDTDGNIQMNEGCLSTPGIAVPITRALSVLLEYQTYTGERKRVVAEGLEARAILHEIDHLDGKNYLEKTSRQERRIALSKIRKRK